MRRPRSSTGTMVAAVVAIGAIIAVAIYFGMGKTEQGLSPEEAQELVHLKNVGLGQLENQKLNEALESFEPIRKKIPEDPLALRNIAVARVTALGPEDKAPTEELLT